MKETQKQYLTNKWVTVKEMFEKDTNGSKKFGTNFEVDGQLNQLIDELLVDIGMITLDQGFDCVIEGVRMDIWKERAWNLLEKAGLLEEYKPLDLEYELFEEVNDDDWYLN
jgi:hypothetical protein